MEKSTKTVKISQTEYDEYLALKQQVSWLMEQLRLSKHRGFGASSEKSKLPDQLSIFDEAENSADANIPEPVIEEIVYRRRKRKGKREDDLSQFPVETISYTLPEDERICPECGKPVHVIGNNTRQELVIIPAQIKVVRHEQEVYACRSCERHNDHVPIVKAPMPEPVIRGSLASPSA